MTTTPSPTKDAASTLEPARWSVAGQFLESLSARDYERMATTLAQNARLRALLPGGSSEWHGRADISDTFASWYGSAEDFEVVDATVGEVARRLLMTWRIRVRPAPYEIGDGWHLIEQHAFADVSDAIEALDLVCSGFRIERTNQ